MPEIVTPSTITVALVEDDAGMQERLQSAIAKAPQLKLVKLASRAQDMMDWLQTNTCHVLLVDLGLPDRSGLEVIGHCQRVSPSTEVMVVTVFADESNMVRALAAGAHGYLLKDETDEALATHVLNLHAGGAPMSPSIARQLMARFAQPSAKADTVQSEVAPQPREQKTPLSTREFEILDRLARGYSYAEIAILLDIGRSTVQFHVKNMYSKLAVHSRSEAIFEAKQLGWI